MTSVADMISGFGQSFTSQSGSDFGNKSPAATTVGDMINGYGPTFTSQSGSPDYTPLFGITYDSGSATPAPSSGNSFWTNLGGAVKSTVNTLSDIYNTKTNAELSRINADAKVAAAKAGQPVYVGTPSQQNMAAKQSPSSTTTILPQTNNGGGISPMLLLLGVAFLLLRGKS